MTRTLRNRLTPALLGVAATAAFGLTVAAPAKAAHAAADTNPPSAARMLPHDTVQQPNYYYCAPAAVRNAWTALGQNPDMGQLATELGTTTDGTRSSADITRVMNAHFGKDRYRTVEIPAQRATAAEVTTLHQDIVNTINAGDPVIVNIIGSVRDTGGQVHSFPGGHYLIVVGYEGGGEIVNMADSADPDGNPEYKLRVGDLAHWIASRGYST